ncbi:MAG: HAMP domain-containing histidine kinase [Erysipelotrichaceae bacterium]|nr:HAMP domain-containing histidine kinase [Erysipelotrichaceae bacterium]
MNKRIRIILPAVSVILLITVLSALLCTFLVKESKVREFKENSKALLSDLSNQIQINHSSEISKEERWLYETEIEYLADYYLNSWERDEEYYDRALAVHDFYNNKTTICDNRFIIIGKEDTREFHLSDYLSKDEILSLREPMKRCKYPDGDLNYLPYLYFDEEGSLVSIEFVSRNNNDNSWKPGTDDSPLNTNANTGNHVMSIILDENKEAVSAEMASCFMPKTMFSDVSQWEKRWTSWMNNTVLQEELNRAKENIKDREYSDFESDSLLVYDTELYVPTAYKGKLVYQVFGNVIFIATYRPWLAAMKELRTIYLLEALLCTASIYFVSKSILKTYDKQKDLDDTRNSFVTAMAHDLKTPLTVIKGYSENLLDNENKEKNDDYLHRIIDKTDEINDMVLDMLDISRIDSSGFEMERKEICLNELLNSVIERYHPLIDKKQIECSIEENGRFDLIGDIKHLDKMLSSLMDNAVSYAPENSRIRIEIDSKRLSISNQSDPIPEDKLKHLFEFSSENDGHHGFGLYFAKKVADIHDLKLKYSYISDGICFTISK